MSESLTRLDRLLVARGFGPRKNVQRLIKRGGVMMNEQVITQTDFRVSEQAILVIKGEVSQPLPALLMYHKPFGQLSTLRDPWGREGLDQTLPLHWREIFHSVGRLDADTSGLLLFSSDGQLTQRLLHPKRMLPRTYLAHVQALPDDLEIQLTEGIETSLGCFTGTLKNVEILTPTSIRPSHATEAVATVELSVCEGKHRMVRRMLHNAGASVLALHRLCYGCLSLSIPEPLAEGKWREVRADELSILNQQMNVKLT